MAVEFNFFLSFFFCLLFCLFLFRCLVWFGLRVFFCLLVLFSFFPFFLFFLNCKGIVVNTLDLFFFEAVLTFSEADLHLDPAVYCMCSLDLHEQIEALNSQLQRSQASLGQVEHELMEGRQLMDLELTKTREELVRLRERYDRLLDSHKKMQKLNNNLEDKLLRLVSACWDWVGGWRSVTFVYMVGFAKMCVGVMFLIHVSYVNPYL